MSTRRSKEAASIKPSCRSERLLHLVTPTEEPRLAGLVNNGYSPSFSAFSITETISASISVRRTIIVSTTGMLLVIITSLKIPLSMPTAEPVTPAPTYATSASSNRPCMVPSSPNVPCRTGKKTSKGAEAPGATSVGLGERVKEERPFSFPFSNLPITSSPVSHLPSCVIPIWVTSYLAGSSTDSTERADINETSCSPERPPKTTAT